MSDIPMTIHKGQLSFEEMCESSVRREKDTGIT